MISAHALHPSASKVGILILDVPVDVHVLEEMCLKDTKNTYVLPNGQGQGYSVLSLVEVHVPPAISHLTKFQVMTSYLWSMEFSKIYRSNIASDSMASFFILHYCTILLKVSIPCGQQDPMRKQI